MAKYYFEDVITNGKFTLEPGSKLIENIIGLIKLRPQYTDKRIALIYNGVPIHLKEEIPDTYLEGTYIALLAKPNNQVVREETNRGIDDVRQAGTAIGELLIALLGTNPYEARVAISRETLDLISETTGETDTALITRVYEENGRNIDATVESLMNIVD